MTKAKTEVFTDQDPDILEEMKKVFDDPQAWLDRPLEWLEGRTPRQLIGTEAEGELRHWLWMLRHGIPT